MDPFILKLVLSFVVGGVWISMTTVVSERVGSKVGGIIGGLPSTIVVGLFFIGWTQGASFVAQSTDVVPAILGADAVFLAICMIMLSGGLVKALAKAFVVWAALALPFVFFGAGFGISLVMLVVANICALWFLERRVKTNSHGGFKIKYKPSELLMRAVFAGSVISFAVIASAVGGPLWGGMFAAFPAVFTSTTVILSRRRGVEFTQAVARMLLASTAVNVTVFVVVCRYAYPAYGIWYGTALGYLASAVSAACLYSFAKKFMK
ncbi:MAG: DUF3147 family protein [archaeon]